MRFSAVLLAGGQSRRMGEDKATILFRNVPLWKIQLDTLRKLRPQELLVSAQTDPPWRPADVQFVADAQPSRGPLSGIVAALSRINNDHLLVLAIDMPFMTPQYLRALMARARFGCGVVPMIANRADPLAAIYPRIALNEMSAALEGPDRSLQSVIQKLVTREKLLPIDVSDAEKTFFCNLNEPADLEHPVSNR